MQIGSRLSARRVTNNQMLAPSVDLAIDLSNVEKIYRGRVYALRGIEMRVRRGEVFGLLGPNGAGKSTLVKIMMTVVRPTRAAGMILDRPIGNKPTLARVGYLPENHRFPRYLTGRQTLEFFAALSGVPRPVRKRRAAELLEIVGMTAWADRKIATHSKGMLQRIGLANAMAHDPDLILLDEPTDGVDPVGRKEIRDVLLSLRARGKTIFINSHMLSELEMVCDRVAILVNGLVARQGTPAELSEAKQRYEIELAEPIQNGLLEALNDAAIESRENVLRINRTEPAEIQPLLDAIRQRGLTIRRVQLVRPSLEDLFMETMHDHAREVRTPGINREGRR
jgi:ABC-2 type transport system ATP-binding protein